jgi:hypothetical protein
MGWKEAINTYPSSIVYEIHGSITVKEALHTSRNSILLTGAEYPYCCSSSHHTVVEIAAKIHEPSMQFPQYICRALYPRFSSLYETALWCSSSLQ